MKLLMSMLFLLTALLLSSCSKSHQIIVGDSLESLLEKAEADPNNEIAQYNLGLYYLSNKMYPEAEEKLIKAVKLNPYFSDALAALYVNSYASDKQLRIAQLRGTENSEHSAKIDSLSTVLDNAFSYNPLFNWSLFVLLLPEKEFILDHQLNSMVERLNEIYYDGFETFFLGKYDEAVEKLNFTIKKMQEFAAEDNESPAQYYTYKQALLYKGLSYAMNKDYTKAIEIFNEGITEIKTLKNDRIIPVEIKSTIFLYLKGFCALQSGQYDLAEQSFKSLLIEDMSFYMAHYQLSNVYYKKNDNQRALRELNAALQIAPDDCVLHYNKAYFCSVIQDLNTAAEEYEKALQINPHYYKASYNVAMIYEYLKENKKAVEYYNKFIETAPLSSAAYVEEAKKKINLLKG